MVATTPSIFSSTSAARSEEHTSELQSRSDLVCRLLLEKKKHTEPVAEHPHRYVEAAVLPAQKAIRADQPGLRRLHAPIVVPGQLTRTLPAPTRHGARES